jgi:hypothetical protein
MPHAATAMESRRPVPTFFASAKFPELAMSWPMVNDAKPSPAALQIAPIAMMNLPNISFTSLVGETI